MKNYKYGKDCNGNIFRIHVETDDEPLNPRAGNDGNLGHMMVWWNRYSLGDKNKYKDPEDFLTELVRSNVSEKRIIDFVKSRKCVNGLELKYNRSEKLWELWGYWRLWFTGNEEYHGVIEDSSEINFLVDSIIESMIFDDKWKLLEREGFYFLPLYIYEHSEITMRTIPFSCRWDSGTAGWIYTTKREILDSGCMAKSPKGNYVKVSSRNWKDAAREYLTGEVEMYDMYLKGECYGYVIDKLDMDDQAALESGMNFLTENDMKWEENIDSCWGFFSDKWEDNLVREIAAEAGFSEVFDTLKEVVCLG